MMARSGSKQTWLERGLSVFSEVQGGEAAGALTV